MRTQITRGPTATRVSGVRLVCSCLRSAPGSEDSRLPCLATGPLALHIYIHGHFVSSIPA